MKMEEILEKSTSRQTVSAWKIFQQICFQLFLTGKWKFPTGIWKSGPEGATKVWLWCCLGMAWLL